MLLSFLYENERIITLMQTYHTVAILMLKAFGTSWIPSLHRIVDDGSTQYPKKHHSSTLIAKRYDYLYLFMYGIFGTYIQYLGYQWTMNRDEKKKISNNNDNELVTDVTTLYQARMMGLFHLVIGFHQTLWAFVPSYGQLKLERYSNGSRFPYYLGGIVILLTGYHGYQLFVAKKNEKELIRHKIMVDFSSLWTAFPVVGFLPMQLLGYPTSLNFERTTWLITSIVPFAIMSYDFLFYKEYNPSSKEDKKD